MKKDSGPVKYNILSCQFKDLDQRDKGLDVFVWASV
jgi:hypothetical protein